MVCAALLFLVFWALPPQAAVKKQEFTAASTTRVHLKSGSTFSGKILSETEQNIRLSVSFGEILLRKEEISTIDRGEGYAVLDKEPEVDLAPVAPVTKKTPKGFKLPPPLSHHPESEGPRAEDGSSPASSPSMNSDRRIEGILSHYLWFFPEGGNMKFLLGAAFFLGFILLFFLASKLAGIEDLSVGKAISFCGVIFGALMVEAHFDTSNLGSLIGYIVIDLGIWALLVKTVLKEPFFRGAGVLAFFVFTTLLGVLASELAYVIVHQPQV